MANRRLNQFRYSLETAVVDLYMQVSFGASGAPTLVTTSPATNQGIVSITRNAAGKYTILLQDSYVRLMKATHNFIGASAPASPGMFVVSDSSSNLASPTIQIQFNAAGVSTDPASGDVVQLQLTLKNSSVQ